MSKLFGIFLGMMLCAHVVQGNEMYDFEVKTITGEIQTLAPYKGKVILVVNVASKCGFTPQYEGLEKLYDTYKDKGLVILGFPSNQFGSQEPGSNQEIAQFCSLTYGVSFPMFSKIDVNGKEAHPLYVYLKRKAPGVFGTQSIKWNFTKFLIDRDGTVVNRFGSSTKPEELIKDIEALL